MRWTLSSRLQRALLALAGLAVLGWLAWHNLSGGLTPTGGAGGGSVQRLDQASSWQYDERGRLAYRLDAPQVTQLDPAEGGGYEIKAPAATLIDETPSAPPWTLRADAGTVSEGGRTIELTGSVHVQRAPYRGRGRLELTTERLWLHPARRLARSDVPARLSETAPDGTPRWHSDANRLALDWGTEVLTQTGRVRDQIQPGSTGKTD